MGMSTHGSGSPAGASQPAAHESRGAITATATLAPARIATSRAEIVAALGARRTPLTLREMRELSRQLQALDEPTVPLRMGVLHTYTTELLQPYWRFEALLQGFDLHLYEAPYGALMQETEPQSGLAAANPDFAYIFMCWEDLDPRLRLPLSALPADEHEAVVADAAHTVARLARRLRQVCSATLVVTLLPRMWGPELGVFDAMAEHSTTQLLGAIKRSIASELQAIPSALFCDLDDVAGEIGRQHLFDLRLWETSRFPYSVNGAQTVVRHLLSYAVVRLQPTAKCIVLDADNTLWGGIVGEEGINGIALGPEYPGSVYVTFQRRLLELQQRGLLLALCSKNNPQDVAEVLAHHPHQVLREEHFAAMRVNWEPKPENLRALAQELNLGLESFVFVDDSAHECLAVRQQLPQVTVVQTPAEVLDLPFCLEGLSRLQITSLTSEDRARTAMYAQQRQRRATAESFATIEEYLASLEMVMRVGFDDERHLARIAQLTQKTNQFNLTTHRYSEAQIRTFMRDPEWLVAHFSLADIFGDNGLVGVALVRGATGTTATVDTLLMSCRVIGRRAEHAFVHHLLGRLSAAGVERVVAQYIPTAKNAMVRDFWPSLGFSQVEANGAGANAEVDGNGDAEAADGEATYALDLRSGVPDPGVLSMRVLESEH